MDKTTLINLCKDCLNDDYDDGEPVESFKAALPDISLFKGRGESDKLTKDEKKLLLHLQDLSSLRKTKKDVQAQVLKLQEEKKRKAEQEKSKKTPATSTNKLASAVQAKERAKLLLQSGAIKLPTARRANFIQHKRSMAQRNAGRVSHGSQDLTPPQSPNTKILSEDGDSPSRTPGRKGNNFTDDESPTTKRPRMAPGGRSSLYDNFVPGGRNDSTMNSPFTESKGLTESPKFRGNPSERGGNTLFVRGFSLSTKLLTTAFESYGQILNINIEEDRERAFVTLDSNEAAAKALDEVHYVEGTILQISYARRQTSRTSNAQGSHAGRDRSTWAMAARSTSQDNRRPTEKTFQREIVKYD